MIKSLKAMTLPTSGPLRLLLLDDHPADAELALLELERAGYQVAAEITQNVEDFSARLRTNFYDLVISDYNLGAATGMDALSILQRMGKDIPFVLVSGSLGDEQAVDCVKQGATDFVLKDNLVRLPLAVRRALTERGLRAEQVLAQAALRQSEQKFAKAFDSSPTAISISTLSEGRYVDVNNSFLQMTGYGRNEILGRTAEELGTWIHPEARTALIRSLDLHGRVLDFEFLFRTKNGEERIGFLSAEVIGVGEEPCLLANIRDDTDRRRAERMEEQNRELEQRNREVERATKLKSQFLASMSHELRTPLTAILGFTGLLIDAIAGPLNDKQRRYAEHIRNGANHLLQLINDILDLSKIEAGQVDLHSETFAIAEALPEVLSLIRPLVMQKKVSLESQTSDARIYADRVRFKQVLYNLLSNATKFTPEGGRIRLACSRVDDQVHLSVSDTGIGIAPEDQSVIFEEFRQVGPATGGLKEGTGLGLAITRRLLERQGGRIWVASQLGQGSCFTFTLPVGAPVSDVIRPLANPSQQRPAESPLILIVESEESARDLLVSYLQPEGYRIATSGPGSQAVEMAAKLRPSAITLNTLTPGRGGWETLASLKINPATAEIPVIIVSVVDQRRMGFAMGAAEYLVKPVARSQLLTAMQKWIPQQKQANILVTDDDPTVVEMVRDCLVEAGYRVLTAFDGRQALRLLDQFHPDALVLDLMMPEVDGFEVIAQIRQNPQLHELPILVLTAKDLTDADLELLSRETRALLHKEFSWREELLRQVNQVVKRTKSPLEAG